MTPQGYFSVSFPEEIDGFIDFLFKRYVANLPSKNIKKSYFKILVYNPINLFFLNASAWLLKNQFIKYIKYQGKHF